MKKINAKMAVKLVITCLVVFIIGVLVFGRNQVRDNSQKRKIQIENTLNRLKDAESSNNSTDNGAEKSDNPEDKVLDMTNKNPDSETDPELIKQIENLAKPEKKIDEKLLKENDEYPYSIKEDKKKYDLSKPDIVVKDKFYAGQINDWYMNFKDYEGKTVEISGFYIDDFSPYHFIGRNGPQCPFCNGGYVSFEFQTDEDMKDIRPLKDWIKIKGVLRKGNNKVYGEFFYIEVLSMEKLDKPGLDPVID